MAKILFHTNLDEAKSDVGDINYAGACAFPSGIVPRVGERIRIGIRGVPKTREYELEVYDVVYDLTHEEPAILVELHIPKYQSLSIAAWEERIKRMRRGEL